MTDIPTAPPPSLMATLDRLLRGDFLSPEKLAAGELPLPLSRFLKLALALGAIYGLCLGTFALFGGHDAAGLQMLSATVKVPLLFALTLVVTFPSLYVFSALQRLPLDIGNTLRLMLLTIVVHLAVIASLGPVFSFFAASTDSYAFMKLLNVAFFATGGVLGFMVLRQSTRAMFESSWANQPDVAPADRARAGQVLRVWCVVYAVVGAQMGWLLRPFLGSPDLAFAWFRERDGNIFSGLVETFRQLIEG